MAAALAGPALLKFLGMGGVGALAKGGALKTGLTALSYAPAMASLVQGDPMGALTSAGGTAVGTRLAGRNNPYAQLIGLGTGLATPALARAGGNMLTGLMGGAGGVVDAATRQALLEGRSGVFGPGVEQYDRMLGAMGDLTRQQQDATLRYARQLQPIVDADRDKQLMRTMQLGQQNAQLTGALNRQLYTAQMGMGAQQQAGANLRTMMTAPNPYMAGVFKGG